MMTNLFVSRDCISLLERRGRILRKGKHLTILPEQTVFLLVPAYRFLETLSGQDLWRVEGRVLTQLEVTRLKARIVEDRIFMGDSTYDVQEGFIGEVLGQEEAQAPDEGEELLSSLQGALSLVPEAEVEEAIEEQPTTAPPRLDHAEPVPEVPAEDTRREAAGDMPEKRSNDGPVAVETPPGEPDNEEELLARYLLGLS